MYNNYKKYKLKWPRIIIIGEHYYSHGGGIPLSVDNTSNIGPTGGSRVIHGREGWREKKICADLSL